MSTHQTLRNAHLGFPEAHQFALYLDEIFHGQIVQSPTLDNTARLKQAITKYCETTSIQQPELWRKFNLYDGSTRRLEICFSDGSMLDIGPLGVSVLLDGGNH